MTEEQARKIIAQLWRNHPSGASTFNQCDSYGCEQPARDKHCDECIIWSAENNIKELMRVAELIRRFRRAEQELIELTQSQESDKDGS